MRQPLRRSIAARFLIAGVGLLCPAGRASGPHAAGGGGADPGSDAGDGSGADGRAAGEDPPPSSGNPAPTWHGDVRPIVATRCLGCHDDDRAKSGFRAATYEGFLRGGEEGTGVVPGAPEESRVWRLLSGKDRPRMPPRREGELEAGDLEVIRRWIEAGAPRGEAPEDAEPWTGPREPPVYRRPPVPGAIALTPDGRRLLVAGRREVLVHAIPEEGAAPEDPSAPLARLVGEAERVAALDLGPEGKRLLVAGGSPGRFGELQLWDLERREVLAWSRPAGDVLYAAAFSPDGTRVACGGTDRTVRILRSDGLEPLAAAEVHSDWVLDVAWSGDGSTVVSAGRDGAVQAVRGDDAGFAATLASFDAPVPVLACRPDGREVLAGARPPHLFTLDELEKRSHIDGVPGEVLAAAWAPNARAFALGGTAEQVLVCRTTDGERLRQLEAPGGWIWSLTFGPGGRTLWGGGHDGRIRVWDLREGEEIAAFLPVPLAGTD